MFPHPAQRGEGRGTKEEPVPLLKCSAPLFKMCGSDGSGRAEGCALCCLSAHTTQCVWPAALQHHVQAMPAQSTCAREGFGHYLYLVAMSSTF
jgi:hypothetical protein